MKQHVHHSYIWLGALRSFGALLIALVICGMSGIVSVIGLLAESPATGAFVMSFGVLIVLVFVAFLYGIIVAVHAVSYKYLWYEVGPEEFSLYSGMIWKKRTHVPYQRIQSVDQKASLLQRAFGVCNISIDTAGGAANKAILVPYLARAQADALRQELYARKQYAISGAAQVANAAPAPSPTGVAAAPVAGTPATGAAAAQSAPAGNVLDAGDALWKEVGGVFAGAPVEMEPVSFEYGLTNKELVLAGISGNAGFAVAFLVVLVAVVQILGGLFDIVPESGDAIADAMVTGAAAFGLPQLIGLIIGVFLVITIIVWAFSILNSTISFGGFHARRRGDRIEVERGLLQHQSQNISIERVQSVIVRQTWIRKVIGYAELSLGKVDAAEADGSNAQSGNSSMKRAGEIVIHPFCKMSRVDELVSGLVPEFANGPEDAIPLANKALRRGILRRSVWQGGGFWLAVFTVICQCLVMFAVDSDPDISLMDAELIRFWVNCVAMVLYVLAGITFVLDVIGAVMWYRESSFGVSRNLMTIVNGGLSRTRQTFPRSKIQFGYLRSNPLQRVAGTCTICAVTAAGVGSTAITLIDVQDPAGIQWLEWLKPRSHS